MLWAVHGMNKLMGMIMGQGQKNGSAKKSVGLETYEHGNLYFNAF
jgi:hypothetical protein